MSFLAALRFLTSIPIPFKREEWDRPLTQQQFARSLVFYPLVGLILGGVLCGLYWIFSRLLPPLLADAMAIGVLAYLTGGLHLDGLIDTFDGLAGGHRSPERRLQIMKTPDVGAMGVVAGVVLLLLEFAALASVPQDHVYLALVLMTVLSRWAMAYAVFNYPYARDTGMGKELKSGSSGWVMPVASIVAAIIVGVTGSWLGIIVMAGTWGLTVMLSAFFKGKFGGLTGDTYGALNEISEFTTLLLVVLFTFNNWL
ncbi:adenosylcobinamide-GDP ribazoletransferase [Dehalogenimonas formicexedens]|uniref:Adenosylcobinamide-GDP ribazoletransferase n=1 Tax=Dehalogenimonas formicexedens TaxID=1839801 RepID=A0A1P8F756_9CHLR|nr:adenosylcobinamide-GDP ribazoletransferase [Dehalogenimonas formicexedens]APV44238.1 adenosylcobinamide-GDP ribazoletransferase [Dehalogenimonas formicexedens]APV44265.1 adenosylcobinamide-GDP ribazoletransferase [Dehalogenimonas formicexedens]